MIIYGLKTKTLKPKEITSYDCENCNSKKTVTFSFSGSYLHVFWIPVFPISKKGISQCSHCKQVLYKKEMTQSMKQNHAAASANFKTPITHYSGLFIIGLAICVIAFSVFKNSSNETEFLANPKINDVYEVEKNNTYTLYKLSEIKGDTLIFKTHNQVVKKNYDIYDLKTEHKNDYSTEVIKFTKNQVNSMKDNSKSDFGSIYSIDRDTN